MRISLVSLNQIWEDKDANFERCCSFVERSVNEGAELVLFPEMTLTGYSLDNISNLSESVDGARTLVRFGSLAKKYQVNLIFGAGLRESGGNKPANYLCHAEANGKSRAIYAKVHPFSYANEDKFIQSGEVPCVISLGEIKAIASICYDLRFPELYSTQSQGCNAGVVIANWPARRISHWRTLLSARAIENQMYMIAVNRIGHDGNGLDYEKSSMIIGPDGNCVKPFLSDEEIDFYDIYASDVQESRKLFPTLNDKKYSLYKRLIEGISHVR